VSIAYANIYASLPWHRKILGIPECDRLPAFGLYCAVCAYCQLNRTDGLLAYEQLVAVFPCPETDRKRYTSALIAARLFDEIPDGVAVHDYLDWNLSKDQIEKAHKGMSAGGRKGGLKSPKHSASPPLKPTLEGSTEDRSDAERRAAGEERSADVREAAEPPADSLPDEPKRSHPRESPKDERDEHKVPPPGWEDAPAYTDPIPDGATF
jgi:hypothetical protein